LGLVQSGYEWVVIKPKPDDVVVRKMHESPASGYLLGTPSAPDQSSLPTREEAVARAVGYATFAGVRAWLANGNDSFELLSTVREETEAPARSR
jgi:hypothetical protein